MEQAVKVIARWNDMGGIVHLLAIVRHRKFVVT